MGTTGLLNTPSADMQETGTFMIGANFLPQEITPQTFRYNTYDYFAGITLFSFLELNYRCILFKTNYMAEKPKFNQQDRSLSARLRIVKEKKYMPGILIGTNDPFNDYGDNYFATVYGVTTKNFHLGGHRLGLSAGYYYPLSDSNTEYDGVFGGISYSPSFCKQLSLIAEYDSSGFNYGAAAKLWKHVSLNVFTREFKCISGGIRYECTLIH